MKRALLALALSMSGCTVVGGLTGAGIVKLHNSGADTEEQKMGYLVPVVAGAAVGLVIDVLILRALGKGLGSYTKQ